MRATVITPAGERLEGVSASLLDYYLGEAEVTPGYEIHEDEADAVAAFPQVWVDGERVDQPQAEPVELVSEVDPDPSEVDTDSTPSA